MIKYFTPKDFVFPNHFFPSLSITCNFLPLRYLCCQKPNSLSPKCLCWHSHFFYFVAGDRNDPIAVVLSFHKEWVICHPCKNWRQHLRVRESVSWKPSFATFQISHDSAFMHFSPWVNVVRSEIHLPLRTKAKSFLSSPRLRPSPSPGSRCCPA